MCLYCRGLPCEPVVQSVAEGVVGMHRLLHIRRQTDAGGLGIVRGLTKTLKV
jgi:hypothetical protein